MFIHYFTILTAQKNDRNNNLQRQLEYRLSPRGVGGGGTPYEPQALRRVQWTTLFRHSIWTRVSSGLSQGTHDTCVRCPIGLVSKLRGTEYLVGFSAGTTPLYVKVKQELRRAHQTLHRAFRVAWLPSAIIPSSKWTFYFLVLSLISLSLFT